MGMPNHLVLVRHGRSEGNLATDAAKAGDTSFYTEGFTTTPGHQWRLTPSGRAQAACAGEWIAANAPGTFDRYFTSPYVRTRETAALLGLPDAAWRLNRALRERDWGDIGSVPRGEFESLPEFRHNATMKAIDPLYWKPPGGESIAGVAEDRVRNVCDTLHRECDSKSVICVGHGELMWAFRLLLERLDDDTFVELDADKSERIHNCEVLHYTRIDPDTGNQAPRLTWLRRARPVETADGWRMVEGHWDHFETGSFTNAELLASVEDVPTFFEAFDDAHSSALRAANPNA